MYVSLQLTKALLMRSHPLGAEAATKVRVQALSLAVTVLPSTVLQRYYSIVVRYSVHLYCINFTLVLSYFFLALCDHFLRVCVSTCQLLSLFAGGEGVGQGVWQGAGLAAAAAEGFALLLSDQPQLLSTQLHATVRVRWGGGRGHCFFSVGFGLCTFVCVVVSVIRCSLSPQLI